MLTSKQRAQLRGMANGYETIFQIGKGGITDEVIKQVENAIVARELIKLRALETAPVSARECADQIAEKIGADVVQVIGTRFVLYKENKENKQIYLVK